MADPVAPPPPFRAVQGAAANGGPFELPANEVRVHLDKVLSSTTFAGSERLRRFLRLVVEEVLEGRGDRLKEYVLGTEALERPPSFDPRTDPGVRVEARRLRAKLADYYQGDGRDDAIVIDLPKGGYVPAFSRRPASPCEAASGPPPDVPASGSGTSLSEPSSAARGWTKASRRNLLAASAALIVLVMGSVALWVVLRNLREAAAPPTVAVLPFASASADPDNRFFCFGLVEDLTTTLAQTRGLRVVARTSAMMFTGSQDAREIGRQLRADYLVEGSVQKSGTRLHVNAQLIRAADGSHVWASTFDRATPDLLAIQGEIAREVAAAIGPRVAPAAFAAQTVELDPETQALYLKGKYFVSVVDVQAPQKGLGYLREVIARAPNHAPTHALAAAAYAKMTLDRPVPLPEDVAAAKAEARRALQLDAGLADAHALLAWIAFFYDWKWDEAERGFQRALTLNPNSATARHRYSLLLMSTRRFEEALAQSLRATELDPLSALVASNRAMILLCARRYDDAIAQARAALELAPGGHTTRVYIGSSYAMKRLYDRAATEYRAAVAAEPRDPDASASLAWVLALAGRKDEARKLLADLSAPSREIPASRYEMAFVHSALGETDRAFEALDDALVRRETELVYLNVDPLFDRLRGDARFPAFLDRLGLPH